MHIPGPITVPNRVHGPVSEIGGRHLFKGKSIFCNKKTGKWMMDRQDSIRLVASSQCFYGVKT
jgi:hypothetical protein